MKPVLVVVLVVLFAVGAYWMLKPQPAPETVAPPMLQDEAQPAPPRVIESPPPALEPLAAEQESAESAEPIAPLVPAESLPALADSDPMVTQALAAALGSASVLQYLVTDNVVSRTVAVIDSLMGRQVPSKLMPVQPPGGALEVTEDTNPAEPMATAQGDVVRQFRLDPVNFRRYTAYVEMLESVSANDLVAAYARFEPLFDQAYTDLGYPQDTFTTRLVEVIDHLLAAPAQPQPMQLMKPEAYYLFADPRLENLTAGQKLMIRMGSDNAARVKTKLREIRQLLAWSAEG